MLGIVEADNTFDGVRVDVRYERVRTCACGEVRLRFFLSVIPFPEKRSPPKNIFNLISITPLSHTDFHNTFYAPLRFLTYGMTNA